MVYEGSTNWLYASLMVELDIKNSIQDSTGLFSVYIVYRTLIRMPIDMMDRVSGGIAST